MSKGNIQWDNDGRLPSLSVPHGGCWISTPGATTITNAGTFYALQGVTTAQLDLQGFTHVSPGKLTYTDKITRFFKVEITVTMTANVNNTVIKSRVAKNGTTDAGSENSMKKTTSTDQDTMSSQFVIQLAQNDYAEIYVTCDSQGAQITAASGTILISEF